LAQITLLSPLTLVTKVVIPVDVEEVEEDVDESLDPPPHANIPAEVKKTNPISAKRFFVILLLIAGLY
jgi:hypothetical protein